MTIVLCSAAVFLLAAGMYVLLRRAPRAFLALAYEKIGEPPPHSLLKKEWTNPARLERVLQMFARRGFKTVLPGELSRGRLPAKPILLAFMGGYQSFYTDVFPLLQKYNAKACVFLAQEYIGTYNAWQNPYEEPWQNLLTETQLKILQKSGLVEFGALDLKARDLTRLPAAQARFGAEENIFRLKKQLGLDVKAFAFWPAKKWNANTLSSLSDAVSPLSVLTPLQGVNEPKKKTKPLKTLRANGWTAKWALWVRR